MAADLLTKSVGTQIFTRLMYFLNTSCWSTTPEGMLEVKDNTSGNKVKTRTKTLAKQSKVYLARLYSDDTYPKYNASIVYNNVLPNIPEYYVASLKADDNNHPRTSGLNLVEGQRISPIDNDYIMRGYWYRGIRRKYVALPNVSGGL
jgi:hypothetical protein